MQDIKLFGTKNAYLHYNTCGKDVGCVFFRTIYQYFHKKNKTRLRDKLSQHNHI